MAGYERVIGRRGRGTDVPVKVYAMYDEKLEPVQSAPHARQKIWVSLIDEENFSDMVARVGDVLRVKTQKD